MTYCFDLDDTLCKTQGQDYLRATPIVERVNQVNKLYNEGNQIIIESARGSLTGKNWTPQTQEQLKKWGLKYHKLRCGTKIAADYYIDDKALNSNDWFK